ncbi:hypothetical protein ACHWQZ_G017128 [Mnemiopsis leidyi]
MITRAFRQVHEIYYRQFHTLFSKEVSDALSNNKPILALESTIITHGLPNPENYNLAQSVETICRTNGVAPATMAVMAGSPCIGLSNEQLLELSNKSASNIKISRRDMAAAIQQKLTGGTTVSGTMILAHQQNIPVFATGGIGGVHRGGENTLDVSADLTELGRTPVAVVCAGVKSILDIAKTLEYLETQGVTVATLGKTRDFPAFFTAKSGLLSHTNVESAKDAAEMILVNRTLNLGSGIVIAVPIPEEYAADGQEIENAIQLALREASDAQISGNAITPFILQRVSDLTSGRSLNTNLALVRNNVLVGSQIAVELNHIQRKSHARKVTHEYNLRLKRNRILVVGAVNVDILCTKYEETGVGKDLARGEVEHVMGGVARNVAECLTRQNMESTLISVVGDDKLGKLALDCCNEIGMDTRKIKTVPESSTPVAQLLLKEGDVLEGICNFSCHEHLNAELISEADVAGSRYVVVDCDTPLETGIHIAQLCHKHCVPLVLEPTAPVKFKQFVNSGILGKVALLSPNATELAVIFDDLEIPEISRLMETIPQEFSLILCQMVRCLSMMSKQNDSRSVLTTIGEMGVLYCVQSSEEHLRVYHLPRAPVSPCIKSTSGAGDSFLGGFLAGLCGDRSVEDCLKIGTFCAFKSLESFDTIDSNIGDKDFAAVTIRSWETLGWNVNVLYDGDFCFDS